MTTKIFKKVKHGVTSLLPLCLFSLLLLPLVSACSDDEWSNDNAEMAHIYYYGLANVKYPGGNELKYSVKQGATVTIPTYFFSAFKRSYSPEVWYYATSSDLTLGTDYAVVDKDGNTLQPSTDKGGYSMVFANAVQQEQDIYIKALSSKKGTVKVLTQDPSIKMDANDLSTTTIVKTSEYEVRAFTENYYVTVNIN